MAKEYPLLNVLADMLQRVEIESISGITGSYEIFLETFLYKQLKKDVLDFQDETNVSSISPSKLLQGIGFYKFHYAGVEITIYEVTHPDTFRVIGLLRSDTGLFSESMYNKLIK